MLLIESLHRLAALPDFPAMDLLEHFVFQNSHILVGLSQFSMLTFFLLLLHHEYTPVPELRLKLFNLLFGLVDL